LSILFAFASVAANRQRALAQSAEPQDCNRPMAEAITHIRVNGVPDASLPSRDGCWLFVVVSRSAAAGGNGVEVYRRNAGSLQSTRFVPIEGITGSLMETPDGKLLLTRSANDVIFLDPTRLVSGRDDVLLGRIGDHRFAGPGKIIVTADNKRMFVRQNQSAWISIIDLEKAIAGGFGADSIVGGIPTRGTAGPSIMMSPDERYLYIPNRTPDVNAPRVCKDFNQPTQELVLPENYLSVLDVQQAMANPKEAVVQEILSGCHAAPFAVSPDGNTLYSILYVDDALLAYDVRPVRSGLPPVLIGKVPTGPAPRDVVLLDEGRKILVSNSNLYARGTSDLTVIDATKVALGPAAVLGTIAAGTDARRVSVTADGRTLFISNRVSQTLQVVDLERALPSRAPAAAANDACNQPLPQPITHIKIADRPADPIPTRDGCWIFVSAARAAGGSGVAVLRRNPSSIDEVRFVPVQGSPFGMVLTHDEKLLIAAAGAQVVFLDAGRLMSGQGSPVLGAMRHDAFNGAIMVNVTSDDRYLFVSQEGNGTISVIDLVRAQATNFSSASMIGSIPAGRAPISLVFSPDERYLYATSQEAPADLAWPIECRPQVNRADPPDHTQGAVLVIDVASAKSSPASSLVAAIRAGCNPVRLALSPDGRKAYVTARTDDAVHVFDTQGLLLDPAGALLGTVPVGAAPVGVAVFDGGRKVIAANSNRFAGASNVGQTLSVIDTQRIAEGAGAVLGTIPTGAFPRQAHVTADGRTLLLTNYDSGTLQVVDLERLPLK
jgi:DNA-binding beta-propeller fold protein YncE